MIPHANRDAALKRVRDFAGSAGRTYERNRNFDFGPDNRSNVSQLSPHVRHRLILEQELLASTLQDHTLATATKFVDEVFWRTYFKGWLEHRPSVWMHYRNDLLQLIDKIETDIVLRERYTTAINAETGIDCFDAWVAELMQSGYLHNHARMWFASIWIYTLKLPWQLGADFLLRHLLDGDPASNTLSWRWVCGLHTKGKTYLARVSNIMSYTDNRFNPGRQLAVSAPPLTEVAVHPVQPLMAAQPAPTGKDYGLLITEEDCYPESLGFSHPPKFIVAAVATDARSSLPVGQPVRNFSGGAVSDALARAQRHFGIEGELLCTDDWGHMLAEWASRLSIRTIATAYAPVGPVADRIAEIRPQLEKQGVRILQLRRKYDSIAWPHAAKGYYKLKSKIPEILKCLEIADPAAPAQQALG